MNYAAQVLRVAGTSATTRASTTSRRQTSTSAATKPFWERGKGSRSGQSATSACNIKNKRH